MIISIIELVRDFRVINILAAYKKDPRKILDVRAPVPARLPTQVTTITRNPVGLRGKTEFQNVVRKMVAILFPPQCVEGVPGCGSFLTQAGCVEMDASIMEGRGRRAAGVACVSNVMYPVQVARLVMEKVSSPKYRHLGGIFATGCNSHPTERQNDPSTEFKFKCEFDFKFLDWLVFTKRNNIFFVNLEWHTHCQHVIGLA